MFFLNDSFVFSASFLLMRSASTSATSASLLNPPRRVYNGGGGGVGLVFSSPGLGASGGLVGGGWSSPARLTLLNNPSVKQIETMKKRCMLVSLRPMAVMVDT